MVGQVAIQVHRYQGFFVYGPKDNAVKTAVAAIYECAVRMVQERTEKSQVEMFAFSTPQGHEVCTWLADHMLSHYASTFARNKLDSLRKVANMTPEDVAVVHTEYCSVRSISERDAGAEVGSLVFLREAILSLKDDNRAGTLKHQLNWYRDEEVSGVNLLKAQNQAEVFFGRRYWYWMCVSWAIFACALGCYWTIAFVSNVRLRNINRSVLSYGVQLSRDGRNWSHVTCTDRNGPCVFDANILASQPSSIVSNLFPSEFESRYVKVLPGTCAGSYAGNLDARACAMRLGILGALGEVCLQFSFVSEGPAEQAWLQHGCNVDGVEGRWAAVDERIGEVQCCLARPSVHVCTRDGCLSGDGDAKKVSWHEANAMCKSRGWRLCRREELNRDGSAGCCGSTNKCGYDEELVWTSNQGGSSAASAHGKLDSDTASEGLMQVTVDLGQLKIVRGVQLQGGVPETMFYGPACFSLALDIIVMVFPALLVFLFFRRASPLDGVRRCYSGLFGYWALICVVKLAIFSQDPAVPSLFSGNPMCPVYFSSTIMYKTLQSIFFILYFVVFKVSIKLTPQRAWIIFLWCFIGGVFGVVEFILWTDAPIAQNQVVWPPVIVVVVFITVLIRILEARNRNLALKAQDEDVKKYGEKWEEVANPLEWTKADLETIHETLKHAQEGLCTAREKFVAKATWWERLLFRISADGIGEYSRTKKRRQRTTDIDRLFEQASFCCLLGRTNHALCLK